MKRALPATEPLTVAILLPDNAPPSMLASLPKSETSLNIVPVLTDAIPTGQVIKIVVWAAPAPAARLAAFLDAHPEVEWLHSLSAGVDGIANIITGRLCDAPVLISNGRGAFSSSLGEYAIAAMLYFNKQFRKCEANRGAKLWDRFTMNVLEGKTLGFVGYGDIAKTTAAMAKPFGMKHIALRRNPGKSAEATAVPLAATYGPGAADDFYAQCDFVLCSLPLTAESKASINTRSFGAMKESCVFISLGRGAVIDEAALHDALTSGKIAGAACDVFATEPLPKESPLWDCDNLLLTAHNADLTADYFGLAIQTWRENLERYRKGEPLATPVDKSAGY